MNKFYFLWIPRTGGTTMWKAIELSSDSYCRLNSFHNSVVRNKEDVKYYTEQHKKIDKPVGRITFSLIRDPFDRIASVYNHLKLMENTKYSKVLENMSFKEYVIHICTKDIMPVNRDNSFAGLNYCNPMEDWLMDDNGEMIPDIIINTACLNKEWETICRMLELDTQPLRCNGSKQLDSYFGLYDAEMQDLMIQKFKYDILLTENIKTIWVK